MVPDRLKSSGIVFIFGRQLLERWLISLGPIRCFGHVSRRRAAPDVDHRGATLSGFGSVLAFETVPSHVCLLRADNKLHVQVGPKPSPRADPGAKLPSPVIFTVELVEDALGLRNQSKPFWFTNAGVRQTPCQYRRCVFLGNLAQASIDHLQPGEDAFIVHDALRVADRRAGRWAIIGRGKDRARDGRVALDEGFCLSHRNEEVFGRFG
jgi:hypothetical protein